MNNSDITCSGTVKINGKNYTYNFTCKPEAMKSPLFNGNFDKLFGPTQKPTRYFQNLPLYYGY